MMLTEVESMKQDIAGGDRREMRGGGHFVLGYSPVLISQGSKQLLNDFRLGKIPVDLRIERSMVSAAVEMTMADGELKELLVSEAKERVSSEESSGVRMIGKIMPGYCAVLIKDGIKQQLRYFGSRHGISADMYQVERILATAAVDIVVRSERLHEKWVQLISETVSWEVGHCYRSAKIG